MNTPAAISFLIPFPSFLATSPEQAVLGSHGCGKKLPQLGILKPQTVVR